MWKQIPEWEDYAVNETGSVKNLITGNLIAGDINTAGYQRVCLYCKKKKKKFFRHRLVAELFIDNPNKLQEVNHKDGNKTNNSVQNLEWCDRVHNEREAHRTLIKEYKPYVVLFNDGRLKIYEFACELANEIKVSKRTVQNYLQGKSFGFLSKGIAEIYYLR